jgi:hypothetical protein
MARAEEIAAAKLGEVASIDGPQPAPGKHPLELIQIQIQLRDAVAELVRVGGVPPMANHALIHGAR